MDGGLAGPLNGPADNEAESVSWLVRPGSLPLDFIHAPLFLSQPHGLHREGPSVRGSTSLLHHGNARIGGSAVGGVDRGNIKQHDPPLASHRIRHGLHLEAHLGESVPACPSLVLVRGRMISKVSFTCQMRETSTLPTQASSTVAALGDSVVHNVSLRLERLPVSHQCPPQWLSAERSVLHEPLTATVTSK